MSSQLDNLTLVWLGREFHPPGQDDKAVYLFKERPTKGCYGGRFYFWRVSDPSLKIRIPAGTAAHLGIKPGALHPLLSMIDGVVK